MNILRLKYFIAIAEHGSITRAAAELHITQPALTRHIAQLEDELRVKLLMRHGRGVRLTEPGHLLKARAATILDGIEKLSDELLSRQTEPQGTLSVGMPYSWSEGVTAPAVREFRERYPEVRLTVIADSSEALEGMLKARYLDFAVLTVVEDDPEVESRPVARDRVYLLGALGTGLAQLGTVSLAEFASRPAIRQHNATVVAKRLDQRLNRAGLSTTQAITTSSSMMLELAELGLGFVAMPGCAMGSRRYTLEAAPIVDSFIIWTLSTLRTRPLTAATKAFESILCNRIRARVAAGEWPSVVLL